MSKLLKLCLLVIMVGFALTAVSSPRIAKAELLFKDDFSSGDFSHHNNNFRWGGSGEIPQPGSNAGMITEVEGPNGDLVNAIKFTYGTWQEVRFHLTESVEEIRTASGPSNVAHSELWISFWQFVPANYFHRFNASGTAAGQNNKGWIHLWNRNYAGFPRAPVMSRIEWWPVAGGLSRATNPPASGAGHATPKRIAPEHLGPNGEGLAFIDADKGQWRHYAFGFRLRSAHMAEDFFVKIYKDNQLILGWIAGDPGVYNGEWDMWTRESEAQNGFDRGYLMGYHNSGYDETTTFYITDFKVGTSPEAVGLSGISIPRPPIVTVD